MRSTEVILGRVKLRATAGGWLHLSSQVQEIGHFLHSRIESNYAILFARRVAVASWATKSSPTGVSTVMCHHDDSASTLRNLPQLQEKAHLRGVWHTWADGLRLYDLGGLAAWLMEAMRPLALVTAQLAYMGQPFLGKGAGYLAKLLESDSDQFDFIEYLSSGQKSGSAAPGNRT